MRLNKKVMANASRTGEKRKGLDHEIAGIILLALALYTAISVFSGISGAQRGGVAGEYISKFLFNSLGYSSCILPLLLLVTGLKLLLRRALTISIAAPVSIGVFMLAVAALMSEAAGPGSAGGAAGDAMARGLVKYTGRAGSVVILFAIAAASALAFSSIFRKRHALAEPEKEEADGEEDNDGQVF